MSNFLQPHGLYPARRLCPWSSPSKNTGVGCHFLLQGIFLTQELNLGLLHYRQILYHLSHQGNPELPYGPAIPLLGINPDKTKTLIQKDVCIPMFTAAWFTAVKIGKQPKYPSAEKWIKKIYNGILLHYIKMKSAIYSNMDGPTKNIMLAKIDQRQILHDNTLMWNLKKKSIQIN